MKMINCKNNMINIYKLIMIVNCQRYRMRGKNRLKQFQKSKFNKIKFEKIYKCSRNKLNYKFQLNFYKQIKILNIKLKHNFHFLEFYKKINF